MPSDKTRVLFLCVHNSFRSQIAEAILNSKYGDIFEAESAGLHKTKINPMAIEVMNDYGIDISNKSSNDAFDFYREGRHYSYIITVCNRAVEKDCPIFPGVQQRINWSFEDPENFTGTHEEIFKKSVELRDMIEKKITEFVDAVGSNDQY